MFDLRKIKPIHIWVLLILVGLMACTETSSNFGKYYRGKTLDVNIVKLERLPELIYYVDGAEEAKHYFHLLPSDPNLLELVILRVKVENHTATSAIVNIDKQSAELRDFYQGKYFPLDVNERVEPMGTPQLDVPPLSVPFLWNKNILVSEDGVDAYVEGLIERQDARKLSDKGALSRGEEVTASCDVDVDVDDTLVNEIRGGTNWAPTVIDGYKYFKTQKSFVLKRDCGIDGILVFEAPRGTQFRELRWRAGDTLSIRF